MFLAPLASQEDVIRAGFEAEVVGYRLTEKKYGKFAVKVPFFAIDLFPTIVTILNPSFTKRLQYKYSDLQQIWLLST